MAEKTYTFNIIENGKTQATLKNNSIYKLYIDIIKHYYKDKEFNNLIDEFNMTLVDAIRNHAPHDLYLQDNPDIITVLAIEYSIYKTDYLTDYIDDDDIPKIETKAINHLIKTDEQAGVILFKYVEEDITNIEFKGE